MKKKLTFNKKTLTVGGLSVLCVAVLTGAYFLTKEPEQEFVPAATEAVDTTNTWEENSEETLNATAQEGESSQQEGSTSDQTQLITSEDASNTTSSLSDTATKEDTASTMPEAPPTTTGDVSDPEKQPEYDSSVPQAEEASVSPKDDTSTPSDTPAADTSHDGQVYDPVFGWIDTGKTQQDSVDSDGDINKQIGSMGN